MDAFLKRIRSSAPLEVGQPSTIRVMEYVLDPEFVTDHETILSSTAKPPREMSEQASSVAVGGGGEVGVGVGVGGRGVGASVDVGEGTGVETDVGVRVVVAESPGVSVDELDVAAADSVPAGVWSRERPSLPTSLVAVPV